MKGAIFFISCICISIIASVTVSVLAQESAVKSKGIARKHYERPKIPGEAGLVMLAFQQALKNRDWERALSYCSKKIRAKAREYESIEAFFKDVFPIDKILSVPEFLVYGKTTHGNEVIRYQHEVKLEDLDRKYPFYWRWSICKGREGWFIDLSLRPRPLDIWLKHERLKLRWANENENVRIENEEKSREGLKVRLVPLSSNFVIGSPILFRLEIENMSNETLRHGHSSSMVMLNDPIIVKDANDTIVPYIDTSYQTIAGDEFVEPGETIVFVDSYDVRSQYHIVKPGRYSFQFRGLWHARPSNLVEIDIKPGQLSPLELVVERLRPILPEGWELTRGAASWRPFEDEGTSKEEIIRVCLVGKRGVKGADIAVFISIFLDADSEAEAVVELGNKLGEFCGSCEWGGVYIGSSEAESLWPEYREQITKALGIEKP